MNDDIEKQVNDAIGKQVEEIRASGVFKRVKEIQDPLVESAKPRFKQSDLGHLRGLIRLAVEFQDYLGTRAENAKHSPIFYP